MHGSLVQSTRSQSQFSIGTFEFELLCHDLFGLFLAGTIGPHDNHNMFDNTWTAESYQSLLGVLAIVVPCSYSTFVATSRIVDNWHHPSDIIAGTLLGIASATIGYHAFYPSTGAVNAGIPLSLQSQQQQQQSSA
jgi:membrane-associated phospholipid phosphatase